MQNSKKGIANIITSFLGQIITLALGIIIPRLVLVNLGSESNGLMTSINTVLTYVALLEAGVGTASLMALYTPVALDDKQRINSILAATDSFYKRSGRWYFIAVVMMTVVFPLSIESTLPTWQIMAVTFLSGMPGVISYYFQGKYQILLRAEGKNYVLTNLNTIIHTATSIAKIVLLVSGCDIVMLQCMYMVFNLIQVIFIMLYMKKHYGWIDLHVKPDFEAIAQSKNVLVHQVSGLVFSNTDTLILTYCCGLKMVSVYSMYTTLFGIISTTIGNFSGINFIMGQSYNTDRQRFLRLLDTYEIFNMTLTFSLFCIANIFILPFMQLYTSGVSDISYIDKYLPYLFIAVQLLSNGRNSSSYVINYAGHFQQTQGRSIFESIINIVISLVCVFKFGIYGVLFGTIAALLYRTNDMIIYANKKILNRSPWKTYRRWLVNLGMFIAFTLISKVAFAHVVLDTYPRITLWATISCVVVIPTFFVVASLCDIETYRYAKALLMPYLHKAWCKLMHKPQAD